MFRLAAASLVAGLAATSAHSAIVIAPGTFGSGHNVLFNNNPPDALTIAGVLNGTSKLVTFTGLETLHGSGGQSRLSAVATGLGYVEFGIGGGVTFDAATFNLDTRRQQPGGTLTITAFDQLNNVYSASFGSLSNGQNFFRLDGTAGDTIRKIRLTTTQDFYELQQVRLDGIASGVPEPSTWAMMLIGFAGLAFASRSRKASAAA